MSKVSKIDTGKGVEKKSSTPVRAWNPFEDMDRMFENHFSRSWMHPFSKLWSESDKLAPFQGKMPSVDMIDRDKEIVVKAEMPGVDKKDLDISVTRNTVTIKGCTSHEEKEERDDYYRSEMSHGSYSRTLSLPADINEDKVKAKYKDGILELTLPKLEETKRQSIKVD